MGSRCVSAGFWVRRKPAGGTSGGRHESRQAFPEGHRKRDARPPAGLERQRPFTGVRSIGRQRSPRPGQRIPRMGGRHAPRPVLDVLAEQRPGLLGEGVDALDQPGPERDLRFARPVAIGQPAHADCAAGLPDRLEAGPQPAPSPRPVDRADRAEHRMFDRRHRRRLVRQAGKQTRQPTHRPPSVGYRRSVAQPRARGNTRSYL